MSIWTIFCDFHDQPIPPGCYDSLNHNDDNDNNVPGNTFDDVFPDKEGLEGAVMTNATNTDDNDEENDNDTEDYDADSETSAIDSFQD